MSLCTVYTYKNVCAFVYLVELTLKLIVTLTPPVRDTSSWISDLSIASGSTEINNVVSTLHVQSECKLSAMIRLW